MTIEFSKYQGTGNDFVLIDNRDGRYNDLKKEAIAFLCHRRYGIGADGFMLLEEKKGYDFRMVYFNSDGSESTMCGNGGRCITAFARDLGIIESYAQFLAIDGPHEATIQQFDVELKMQDVSGIEKDQDASILNTGSPHFVKMVQNLEDFPVFEEGRKLRNREKFGKAGINVNFVEQTEDTLSIRTYERGVEDETFSCGTGVTAGVLATMGKTKDNGIVNVHTKGGMLRVKFQKTGAETFQDIWLCGPARFVFKGSITL
jgi:diaminopimelate epimerase